MISKCNVYLWIVCLSVCLKASISCLSVYLFICLSFYMSIFQYVYISICLSFYLSICLSVYLSICLSVYLSFLIMYSPTQLYMLSVYFCSCATVPLFSLGWFCLSVYRVVYLSICLSINLSICLSVYLSTFLTSYLSISKAYQPIIRVFLHWTNEIWICIIIFVLSSYLYILLDICLSNYYPIYLSIYPSKHLFQFLPVLPFNTAYFYAPYVFNHNLATLYCHFYI